ncbi:mannose-6-phosphate isomerase, class I [Oceanivirga salmonicida]|uniref:mannose-6-phosphate isomerase, class I n=1 Tax=Oceanivirga salmonicida TaxID=1769291 RepID=UPI0012E12EA6|nr:mannose-6-phosphate isomerase, class I [Oceanivirga salmonicida]
MELIFMKPYMKEVIWGGEKIKREFNYETNSDKIGEAWIISANDNGYSTVINGKYKGLTLKELWNKHKELFGNEKGEIFPLLVKYIDAKSDLSVQVHPDDEYARANEGQENGKSEAWYILDCEEGSDIEIGHSAKTKDELREMVYNKKWNELLTYRKIKKGDFFDIPPGTVHAIRKGTLILEIQQNSDITYRFYDYDRLQNGKLRELHIEKSLDVTICPHKDTSSIGEKTGNSQLLVKNNYFSVKKYEINEKVLIENNENFLIVCVINGSGSINNISIKKGDNFIVPYKYGNLTFDGNLEFMLIRSEK